MRNVIAALALGFSAQQVAWTVLDFQGLQQYGTEGWPYDVNPLFGAIIATFGLVIGIFAIERRPSFSRPAAIALGIFAGVHFWIVRKPASPYTDYGEDNFTRLFLNLILIVAIMLVIYLVELQVQRRSQQNRTEQDEDPKPDNAPS